MNSPESEKSNGPQNRRDDDLASGSDQNSLDELEKRAKRGSKKRFRDALAKVPDVESEPFDKL